jgi:RNA polymerase primary sigma factor
MTTPLLTAADEIRLARRIERGEMAAKDEMVVRNLRLVHALAARYTGRGAAYDDLVQEGTIGLIRAVEKFDHRRGLKFSTYAVWWIRRSLMDALSDARTIRIPRAAQRRMSVLPRVTASLDQPVADDLAPLGELIADETTPDVGRQAEQHETRRQLFAALALLPERHRQVVVRRHGLVADCVQTHQQIGASLGIGEERSRQIERQALHRLRELGPRVPRAA